MVGYYAGLATDQARCDGARRGPVEYYLDPVRDAPLEAPAADEVDEDLAARMSRRLRLIGQQRPPAL